ncbi:MAG: PAS domain S-box protein [Thermostichus sp. HHBFW_bins_43]
MVQGSGSSPPLDQFLELVPLLVKSDSPVAAVIELIAQKNAPFRYALVGDSDQLLGIFTATDALQWVANGRQGSTIAEVMTAPVLTFAAQDYRDPFTLLRYMQAHRVHHLPIVDETGSLLGVVNQEDLCLKLLQDPQSLATADATHQALLNLEQLQREALEEELRTGLNLRLGIEQSIPLGIAAADLEGKQIYVNDTFAAMVGWPKADLIGRDPPYPYWPPEELETIQQAFREGLERERPLQGWELIFRRRNGERFPVRILDAPWRDSEGHLIGMIASVQDLTSEREILQQQRRLEDSLKHQEDLFQRLFDLSTTGMFIANGAGQIIKVNDSFCQLTGYSRSELLAMNSEELTYPEDLPQERMYVEELNQGQRQSFRMEKRYICKTGEILWVDLACFVVDAPEGGIYGVVSVTDITERKQTQAQDQHQLRQARLLSHITQGIRQFLDVESILNFTVREVRLLLNVDRVVIYRFLPHWAGEIAAESISQAELSLLGEVIEDFCFMSQWHQPYQLGRISAIEDINFAPIQPCHRELLAGLGVRANLVVPILQAAHLWGLLIAHHCTEPKSWDPWMPESLKQLADQLGLALQQADLFQQLQATNAELRYQVEVRNAELHQLVSYEQLLRLISDKVRSSLNEKDILEIVVRELTQSLQLGACGVGLIDPETHTYTLAYESAGSMPALGEISLPLDHILLRQLNQGQTLHLSLNHPSRGWCTVVACPLFTELQDPPPAETSPSQPTTSLLGFLELIRLPREGFTPAEIRFAEQIANQCSIAIRQARLYQKTQTQLQQLMELNQLKEDFLNMVSHELRTPLTSMKMALKMLEVSGIAEPQARYFNILKEEWQKELDLVNDLLDLQRLESGNHPLEPICFSLQEWLEGLLAPFVLRFQERQLTFIPQIPPHPISFTTDVGLLTRILSELLNNAAKYTPAGEQVHLWVSTDSPYLRLRVTNTGVQIPPEHLPRIFEKFHRVRQLDHAQQGGTGLGLPLVKKAVELLRGDLWVESQENRTLFEVSLPNLSTEGSLPNP